MIRIPWGGFVLASVKRGNEPSHGGPSLAPGGARAC
jgi:hypothetical protein